MVVCLSLLGVSGRDKRMLFPTSMGVVWSHSGQRNGRALGSIVELGLLVSMTFSIVQIR